LILPETQYEDFSTIETPGTILSTEDGGCIVAGITRSDNYDVVGFHETK
jgi:hypothetical protein